MKEESLVELTNNMLQKIEKIEDSLHAIAKIYEIDYFLKNNSNGFTLTDCMEIRNKKKDKEKAIFELTCLFGTKATGFKGEIK